MKKKSEQRIKRLTHVGFIETGDSETTCGISLVIKAGKKTIPHAIVKIKSIILPNLDASYSIFIF